MNDDDDDDEYLVNDDCVCLGQRLILHTQLWPAREQRVCGAGYEPSANQKS